MRRSIPCLLCRRPLTIRSQTGECGRTRFIVLHRGDGNTAVRLGFHGDESIWLWKGQRFQQHRVENGEDCRRRTNAQGERQYGGGGETGASPKLTKRIAKKCKHNSSPRRMQKPPRPPIITPRWPCRLLAIITPQHHIEWVDVT